MRTKLGIAAAIILAIIALLAWRIEATAARILETRHTVPSAPLAIPSAQGNAANGFRLAHIDGCFSCHGEGLRGKLVLAGMFGTRITAPNLTGIAHRWSDAQLAAAIRYGVKPNGTTLIDMPSAEFLKSSDSDIADIIAYLKSAAEKPDAAAKTQWSFGGKAMLAMHLLPLSVDMVKFARRGPKQTPTQAYARGHYLTGVHCASCHGPDLTGDPEVDSPDLHIYVRHYSLAVFARFFATGTARKGHGTPTMTPLIHRSLHYLTKQDVQAIYTYLQKSPAK